MYSGRDLKHLSMAVLRVSWMSAFCSHVSAKVCGMYAAIMLMFGVERSRRCRILELYCVIESIEGTNVDLSMIATPACSALMPCCVWVQSAGSDA